MPRRALYAVVSALTVALGCWAGAAAQPSGSAPDRPGTPRTYEGLSLRIALMLKMAADERYIAAGVATDGNRDQLLQAYGRAADELRCDAAPGEAEAEAAVRRLLCADIDYRRFLINRSLPFWGGVRTLVPELPPVHLRRLRGLLADFERLAGEMEVSTTQNEAVERELLSIRAAAQEGRGQAQASALRREASAIRSEAERERAAQLQGRLEALREQRVLIQRLQAQARAEREAASAALTQTLVSAVTAAVGAPDWVADAARAGSPERALRAATVGAISGAVGSDGALSARLDDALGRLGTSTSELVELYGKAREFQETARQYGNALDQLRATLRQPTLEGLLEVGAVAWQALPEDQRREWRARVQDAAPVLQVAALVARPGELSDRLRGRVLDAISEYSRFGDFLSAAAESYLVTRIEEASQLYVALLDRVASVELGDAEARLAVDSFVRSYARWMVDTLRRELPPAAMAELRRAVGVSTDLQLEAVLSAEGLRRIPRLRVEGGAVLLRDGAGTQLWRTEVVTLLRLPGKGEVVVTTERARSEVRRVFAEFGRQRGALRDAVAQLLPFEQLEAGLRDRLVVFGTPDANRMQAAWRTITAGDPQTAADAIDRVASMQVASVFVDNHGRRAAASAQEEARAYGTPPQGTKPQPGAASPEQRAMMMALDAALPGLGTGLSLAGAAVEALASMSAANSWLDSLQQELSNNLASEARLIDLRAEARTAEEIAAREALAFEALRDAYEKAFETRSFATEQAQRATDRQRARVDLRRALTFYLAERLREEFDLLDRAVGLWSGIEAAPRDQIARLIRDDPQNARLALDTEIRLFAFLERDLEGLRTDVDRLLVHWRQLVRLAEDACGRIGCEADVGAAQVRQTRLLSVCEMLDEPARRRLVTWLANPSGRLRLRFFIGPAELEEPDEHVNHRLIDVRLGGAIARGERPCEARPTSAAPGAGDEAQRLTALRQATLAHPGIGYIRRPGGRVARESLLYRRSGSFAPPQPFDVDALRRRWIETQAPHRRFFEGYPAYSEYELVLHPEEAVRGVTDIVLRFAYQYQDPINVFTEQDFVAAQAPTSVDPYRLVVELDGSRTAGRDPQGRPLVVRLPSSARTAADLRALSLVSTVGEALAEQRSAASGVGAVRPPRTTLAGDEDLGFRILRLCKSVRALSEEMLDSEARRLGASQATFGQRPYDLLTREIAGTLEARRPFIEREARRTWEANRCAELDRRPHVLVGRPLPPGGGN